MASPAVPGGSGWTVLSIDSSTQKLRLLVGVCALAVLAYLPAQFLPFISDDYVHIGVARKFGAPSAWPELFADPLYRFRAPSSVLAWILDAAFGLVPLVFNLASLLSHVVCSLLVAALGVWKPVGWRISIPSAAFFAVAEGHQEAVVWFASIPELHVFMGVLAAFLCWVRWIDTGRYWWYFASLAAFGLGLLSKESAVCLVGLQAVALWAAGRREVRAWTPLAPFAILAAAYFALIYSTRSTHQHFNDGTFAIDAPFWLVIPASLGRMLWIWGFVSIAILFWLRRAAALPFLLISLAWAVIAIAPYSFLTYMARVPSRHTYLASVAVALLAGAALAAIRTSRLAGARQLSAALALLMLAHNIGYLWTYKHGQYVRRAAPTEELIRTARSSTGDIVVECFPYSENTARQAVAVGAGQPDRTLIYRSGPHCSENFSVSVVNEPAQQIAGALRDTT